jgi:glyoxylase-like metal-dependent hydrolase (beta-lactamase superfamily II)
MPFSRVSRFGLVNCYLVEEEDGLSLIDTMIPGSAKGIIASAEQHGKPIVRIVLTHAHQDHIGSVDALHKALPEAEVIIGARDARLLKKDKTPDPGEPADAKYRGGYPGAKTEPTRTVAPGDRIGSLEVIAAPGHTPGHVAYLDSRDGTLFCGDAYTTIGGVHTSATFSLPFPFAYIATWHRPTELETARALRALNPNRLAPGHGKVVENPGDEMDAAIAKSSDAA